MALKQGPLSKDDLLAIWKGATDESYNEPLLTGGDGGGLEPVSQAAVQFARASMAVDVATQAMFISPWSGQTNDPASGSVQAAVVLTVTRSGNLSFPLVLKAGTTWVQEQTTTFSPSGSVPVLTNRLYSFLTDVVFPPGDKGPKTVNALAEKPGYGYNNPLPNAISVFVQNGTEFYHDRATVTLQQPNLPFNPVFPLTASITTVNEADTFIPDHVGQFVQFTGGANIGRIARISQVIPPDTTVPRGSIAILALDQAIDATSYSGSFTPGEVVKLTSPGPVTIGYGTLLSEQVSGGVKKVTFTTITGGIGVYAFDVGDVLTGLTSGATATISTPYLLDLINEVTFGGAGGASWKILDFAEDLFLGATNPVSPSGGKLGMLDLLGRERNIDRFPGESDDAYRPRIALPADVVTPNAIKRTLSKVTGTVPYCFREVGSEYFQGFFYDGDNAPPVNYPHSPINDAYDVDTTIFDATPVGTFTFQEPCVVEYVATGNLLLRGYFGTYDPAGHTVSFIHLDDTGPRGSDIPFGGIVQIRGLQSGTTAGISSISIPNNALVPRRFRTYLDYEHFRAYFIVGLPRLDTGDYGFAYDNHPLGAYDATPFNDFYDGKPYLAQQFYQRVWNAVNSVKAGGVEFDLYFNDDDVCTPADLSDVTPVFSPLVLPNLFAWLTVQTGIFSSGGVVATWADQSGNHNDFAQASVPNRPTVALNQFGLNPSVHFSGTQWLEIVPHTFGTGWMLHVVFKVTPGSLNASTTNVNNPPQTIFGGQSPSVANTGLLATEGRSGRGTGRYIYSGTAHDAHDATADDGLTHTLNIRHDQTTNHFKIFIDGLQLSGTTAYSAINTTLDRLGVGDGNTEGFRGDIAEVIVCANGTISDATVQSLRGRAILLYGAV